MLREGKHESWEKIASKVVNLQGEHPCWGTVRNIVSEFNVSRGHRQYKYEKYYYSAGVLISKVGIDKNFRHGNVQTFSFCIEC